VVISINELSANLVDAHPGGPTPWIWPKVCICPLCSDQKPTSNSWHLQWTCIEMPP